MEQVYVYTAPIQSSKTLITTSPNILLVSIVALAANANRIGLYIYNNSANSAYITLAATGDSGNSMTLILATFATWFMPMPIYTGVISAKRNAGSGSLAFTELLK